MPLGPFTSKPVGVYDEDTATRFWADMERMREYINQLERDLKALELKHNALDLRAKSKGI